MQINQLIADRYRVDAVIGRGGMGEVFKATDTQTGASVAIKVLKPEIVQDNPGVLERFRREGEALSSLNHPNIAKVLGMFEADGEQCIVMEYISGGTLYDMLKEKGPLPIPQVLEIALDLSDALTRAHRLNIIHRDIKPGNVLLAEDGTPRLTDFGAAQIGDRTRMTEVGSVLGTYAYLSPESLSGEMIDERADVWSFGVMLFEMLTGQRPFTATMPGALFTAILTQPIPAIQDLRPETPVELVELVEKMLAKEPQARIGSVRQVGAALEKIIREAGTDMISSQNDLRRRIPVRGENSVFTQPLATGPTNMRTSGPVSAPGTASTTIVIPEGSARVLSLTGVVLVLIVGIAIAAFLSRPPGEESAGPQISVETGGTEPSLLGGAEEIITLDSPKEGRYRVLVAQIEQLGGTNTRDVGRFLRADLENRLAQDVPFSEVEIIEYPAAILSSAQALAAAEANQAEVVVWGTYDDELIALDVQLGSLAPYPQIAFDREVLADTANVRVRLASERTQSITPQVLGVLAVIQVADGDGYEIMRTFAALDQIDVEAAEIEGTGVSALAHRFSASFFQTPEAISYIDQAIGVEPNPLLYTYRGMALFRRSAYEESLQDAETAARLGPSGWAMPLYLEGNYYLRGTDESFIDLLDESIQTYDEIVTLRPEDWYAWHTRGTLHYLNGQYDLARQDLEQAISLGPDANFPYVFATQVALREGRISDAQQLMKTVLTEFPDPSFGLQVLTAVNDDMGATNIFGPIFSAYGNLVLGQYRSVLVDANRAAQMNSGLADLNFFQAYALCNLGDLEQAVSTAERGLEKDPSFAALHLLLAETYEAQGDEAAAEAERTLALSQSPSEEFTAWVQASQGPQITCQNLLMADLAAQS